jgi:hypothetical protein
METAVDIGNYSVPGLAQLMDARLDFLNTDAEFSLQSPSIFNVQSNTNAPNPGSAFSITATVSDAQNVWLGKRYSTAAHFSRIPMYDDGLHDDGVAGDAVYGAEVLMLGDSLEYYIYAEDSDAGVFSPMRAEHEFHLVYSSVMDTPSDEVVRSVIAYPNPCSGVVHFNSYANTITEVCVYDMRGTCVKKICIQRDRSSVDLTSLAEGMYVLKWDNQHQTIQVLH